MKVGRDWLDRVPTVVAGTAITTADMLAPKVGVDSARLEWELGRELRRNFTAPDEVANVLATLGAGNLANHLRENVFPTRLAVRHGDFGEAVSGAIFRQGQRYVVPVLKLRHKHDPNQPVRGADNLAFRFLGLGPANAVVAVVEIKTYTSTKKDIGEKAYTDLVTRVSKGLGPAITFLHRHTVGHNPALATRIAELLGGGYAIEHHVFLIFDEAAWDDEVMTRLLGAADTDGTSALVSVVKVNELRPLIAAAYHSAETP